MRSYCALKNGAVTLSAQSWQPAPRRQALAWRAALREPAAGGIWEQNSPRVSVGHPVANRTRGDKVGGSTAGAQSPDAGCSTRHTQTAPLISLFKPVLLACTAGRGQRYLGRVLRHAVRLGLGWT
eukprot:2816330-Rhodomonas_salina.6